MILMPWLCVCMVKTFLDHLLVLSRLALYSAVVFFKVLLFLEAGTEILSRPAGRCCFYFVLLFLDKMTHFVMFIICLLVCLLVCF